MSCTYCRARHYKCDENLPKCRKCERAGRRCVREPPRRFRHFNAPSQSGQKQIWLPVPPKVDFVDETSNVVDGAEDAESSPDEENAPAAEGSPAAEPQASEQVPGASLLDVNPSPTASAPVFAEKYPSPTALSPFSHHPNRIPSLASSPTYAALRELGRSQHYVVPDAPVSIAQSPGQLSQTWLPNQWPLQSEEEAMLLRFFLDHISTFFDLCDPYRYFRYEVPQRARTNKTLANAILAISARMMHWKTGYNPYIADRYLTLCLETLIPSLSDVEAVMDETLLAATVVLRMLEEMDVHISGSDTQGHLTGSQAIISVAASSMHRDAPPVGLRRAAYWSAFRQEVWIAPQTQQPICMSPAVCGYAAAHGFGAAPDWVWCERSIAHCGEAMNCTLQTELGRDEAVARWKALVAENDAWWEHVPPGFDPFYGSWERRDAEFFPEVKFQADWHVMGYSYTIEAHLLLVVHDPTIPKLGPLRRRAVADMDERAKEDVRKLCGLAQSNEFAPAASLIACMAISLCGDRFIHLSEQQQLYDFLYKTEKRHGWPTAKARSQLQEAWGWEPRGSNGGTPAAVHPASAAMTPPP